MGSPLSVSFANIFVGYHERRILNQLPNVIAYLRYVNDTHVVLPVSEKSSFFAALNALHSNLAFTEDVGTHFLDVNLHVSQSGILKTSVNRKPTFSGLYTNYGAFCPKSYKVNLVRTLSRDPVGFAHQSTFMGKKNFFDEHWRTMGIQSGLSGNIPRQGPRKKSRVRRRKLYSFLCPTMAEQVKRLRNWWSKRLREPTCM